jgi:hypothetical protein
MLRLDPETAKIPVLSYVRDGEVSSLDAAGVDLNPMRLPNTASLATKVPN